MKLLCFRLCQSLMFQCTGNSDQEFVFRTYIHFTALRYPQKQLCPSVTNILSASNSMCCCSLRDTTVFVAISISHLLLLANLT